MILSKKLLKIESSATLDVIEKVNELKAKGENIISFGAGEPDFDTPKKVRDVAKKAIDEGFTHYTNVSGIMELKKAIINKLKKDNGVDYTPDNIVVSNGAKHSLYNVLSAILNKGDEVLIQTPYWVSYPEMVKLVEGKPVFVETRIEENFKLTAKKLEEKITDKTKAIILNNPNNPTGNTIDKKELQKIADLAIKNNLFIISDEIYEKLLYEGKNTSIASLSEEIKKRTIIVNGVSKAYAMTGWRIGYLAADKKITALINGFQGHTTSNPNSIAQKAASAALKLTDLELKPMLDEFKKRRDFMYEELKKIKKLKLSEKPKGAFYIMGNIENYKMTSKEFCNYVLEEAKVAIVPGIAFGEDKYIRFSYANSIEEIKEGIKRLQKLL